GRWCRGCGRGARRRPAAATGSPPTTNRSRSSLPCVQKDYSDTSLGPGVPPRAVTLGPMLHGEVPVAEISLPKDGGTSRPKARRRLGEVLLDNGVITPDQLDEVLARQKLDKNARLGRLLVDLGFATEHQICEVVAEQLRIPAADMVAVDVGNDV